MGFDDKKHRSHLPIATPERAGFVAYDAKDPDTKFPPIEQLRPPVGAPNVLLILIDDAGFGSSSAFGGPCRRRTWRHLAAEGLQIQPLSHHRSVFADAAGADDRPQPPLVSAWAGSLRSPPGRPDTIRSCRTRVRRSRETLKLNGYSTAQFGKCHEVPVWETSPVGPFDAWPTGGGGFRIFLRIHRRRGEPMVSGALRRHDPGRSRRRRPKRATTLWRT